MLKKAQHDCPMGRMQFNVTDLEGEVVNGILSIKVPLVTLRGPLISPERMEDLEEAGYEPREVGCSRPDDGWAHGPPAREDAPEAPPQRVTREKPRKGLFVCLSGD